MISSTLLSIVKMSNSRNSIKKNSTIICSWPSNIKTKENSLLICYFFRAFVNYLIQSIVCWLMLVWNHMILPFIRCGNIWNWIKNVGEYADTWMWKLKMEVMILVTGLMVSRKMKLDAWRGLLNAYFQYKGLNNFSIIMPICLINPLKHFLVTFMCFQELFQLTGGKL